MPTTAIDARTKSDWEMNGYSISGVNPPGALAGMEPATFWTRPSRGGSVRNAYRPPLSRIGTGFRGSDRFEPIPISLSAPASIGRACRFRLRPPAAPWSSARRGAWPAVQRGRGVLEQRDSPYPVDARQRAIGPHSAPDRPRSRPAEPSRRWRGAARFRARATGPHGRSRRKAASDDGRKCRLIVVAFDRGRPVDLAAVEPDDMAGFGGRAGPWLRHFAYSSRRSAPDRACEPRSRPSWRHGGNDPIRHGLVPSGFAKPGTDLNARERPCVPSEMRDPAATAGVGRGLLPILGSAHRSLRTLDAGHVARTCGGLFSLRLSAIPLRRIPGDPAAWIVAPRHGGAGICDPVVPCALRAPSLVRGCYGADRSRASRR